MRMRAWVVWTAVLAVVFMGLEALQAQTTDRAGIEGKVVDQGGGVMPGVTVSIGSTALQSGTRTTVTDYDYGAFQEVQIKAMGNDAEMATPGTMFLGILKSGGDQFHGSGLFS